jgi:hypothetical protein
MSNEPSHPIQADQASRVRLTVKVQFVPLFFPILQKGFVQKIEVGCSVMALLSGQLGLSEAYIENRIQTIFLNGKPIDDMHTAIIRDGASLALSSAMPGVLGATLRRGGYYSRMRSQITHVEDSESLPCADGRIIVKLFNLTIRELGPMFLERGIWIEAEDLRDFFKSQWHALAGGCIRATVDDKSIDAATLRLWDFTTPWIYFQLHTA